MLLAWRLTKIRHDPWDGTGAMRVGARWSSPGRPVIYAADSFAGTILELLVHALKPRTLPGSHHAIRIDIPEDLVERAEEGELAGWELRDSGVARDYGDDWLASRRSAVLVAPALTSRPIGRTVLINPLHEQVARIERSRPFVVPWDERLY
jgi:RES domain-containing protein